MYIMNRIVCLFFGMLLVISCVKDFVSKDIYVPLTVSNIEGIHNVNLSIDSSKISSCQIGIQITDINGQYIYDNQPYQNLLLNFDEKWRFENKVSLSSNNATIFAYYPYSTTEGSVTGIGSSIEPMEVLLNINAYRSDSEQIDYLWGKQDRCIIGNSNYINNSNNQISLKLNHALSQISFVIYKDNYPGEGVLDEISIVDYSIEPSFKISNNLKLKVEDGSISGGELTNKITLHSINSKIQLNSDPGQNKDYINSVKNASILIVPVSGIEKSNIEFVFKIDNVEYQTRLTQGLVDWNAGKQYIYKVMIRNNKLDIIDTMVMPWLSSPDTELPINNGVNNTSNCYILQPCSSIIIPVGVKGNGKILDLNDNINVNHTAISMGILWQTSGTSITLSDFSLVNQTVKVSSSNDEGNALIAAFSGLDQTGQILWSWHIWVTNYNPNIPSGGNLFNLQNSFNDNYIIMDRNLGALSPNFPDENDQNTLYYQFGRKDPFPGGDYVFPVTDITELKSIQYSILNPTIFVRDTSILAWHSNPINNYWSKTSALSAFVDLGKTIFDPCPSGWRVPNNTASSTSVFSGLSVVNGTNRTTGWEWLSPYEAGYYPFVGYIDKSTGSRVNFGKSGAILTARRGTGALALIFDEANVSATGSSHGGNGSSVRCVKN